MADKINGLGRPPVDISRSQPGAVGKADDANRAAAAKQPGAPDDGVSITSTATSLQRIEAELAALPEIDERRVEEIRQQVESGTYRINAERLADRLIRAELGLL
ncbi:MAG: flagellar biosynthesis anti-sigma factor FlgM [Gammaproteobacteria bacterium]